MGWFPLPMAAQGRRDLTREAMLEELGLDKVTLVGRSMGRAVAYVVAMQQPSRLERLVIEVVSPPYPHERPSPRSRRAA